MIDFEILTSGEPVIVEHEFYHKGGDAKERDNTRNKQLAKARVRERIQSCRMIAWDGEGIDLSGPGRPQHYVLFGCSAESQSPLVIQRPDQKLTYKQIARYVCDIGSRYPDAKHIGYGFRYDQNMVVGTMPIAMRLRLQKYGIVGFRDDEDRRIRYRIKVIWGKFIRFTRENLDGQKVSVKIDDIISFFHLSFLKQYKQFFPDREDQTVIAGKARRGVWSSFSDLPEIREYWQAEIAQMEEMATYFRDLMVSAGIYLSDWYGPGAIANFIRREHKLNEHEWGGKEQNLDSRIHSAIKHAYYGGRFEQGIFGRIRGPIYGIDINSAYPFALTNVPTLREGGTWVHTRNLNRNPNTFGLYFIHYRDAAYTSRRYSYPQRSDKFHPFPHRNRLHQITYPAITSGWYWGPEVHAAKDAFPELIEVVEGYEWLPATDERPWKVILESLYEQRQTFKRNGNPAELAVKLAINSLYGKMAQRVGWDEETNSPPRSHTLCIAGYVTAYCRAMIYRVVSQIPVGSLVAIETDAVYTSMSPDSLTLPTGIGKELGQWGLEGPYDELMYVQSGVYAAMSDGKWGKLKTRGFSAALVNPGALISYLQSLTSDRKWPLLQIEEHSSEFIGLGLAIQRSRNKAGSINEGKLAALHCQWYETTREIDPAGSHGKRAHVQAMCPACREGFSGYDAPHLLVSNHGIVEAVLSAVTGNGKLPEWNKYSAPHLLPWETKEREPWRAREEELQEVIRAEKPERVTTHNG